jgi:hypothetical protein
MWAEGGCGSVGGGSRAGVTAWYARRAPCHGPRPPAAGGEGGWWLVGVLGCAAGGCGASSGWEVSRGAAWRQGVDRSVAPLCCPLAGTERGGVSLGGEVAAANGEEK